VVNSIKVSGIWKKIELNMIGGLVGGKGGPGGRGKLSCEPPAVKNSSHLASLSSFFSPLPFTYPRLLYVGAGASG